MNDPYSRVYWSVMDDPKFDGIREDVRLFGSWSLMLVVADMAWPAPAFVPPTVPKACAVRLGAVHLIDLLDGHRYRVHGLDAERDKRSHSARNAAAVRWHSDGNAEPMLDEDETRRGRAKAEPRRDEAPATLPADDGRPDLEAWAITRFSAPTERQRAFIDRYCSIFDVTGPERAAGIILSHPGDPIGALKGDLDAFRKERAASLPDESKAAALRKVEDLRKPTVLRHRAEDITDEEADRIAREYMAAAKGATA
jgi:hypothetical protein